MLATYTTYINTNKLLRIRLNEHKQTKDVLKITVLPEEDFLTVMRNRRKDLEGRNALLMEKMKESANKTKKLIK